MQTTEGRDDTTGATGSDPADGWNVERGTDQQPEETRGQDQGDGIRSAAASFLDGTDHKTGGRPRGATRPPHNTAKAATPTGKESAAANRRTEQLAGAARTM